MVLEHFGGSSGGCKNGEKNRGEKRREEKRGLKEKRVKKRKEFFSFFFATPVFYICKRIILNGVFAQNHKIIYI
jgi:hypothetical protein